MFRSVSVLLMSALAIAAGADEAPQLHLIEPELLASVVTDVDATMLGHYGKPPEGCAGDEKAFQISGVPGMVRGCACVGAAGSFQKDLEPRQIKRLLLHEFLIH